MLKRPIVLAISILLSSVMLLTSCQLARTTPAATGSATRAGGVLNLAGTNPTTLDPAMSAESTSIEYILQIFSGLVRLDQNLAPVPDIAQSWDVSNGGKTYTFHLRKDAKFQNGRPVTAEDFKYSWERACNPATGSSTAGTYLGDIVGVKQMLAGQSQEISGVQVIDDYTLQVTIDAPRSYFLSKLTFPVAFVVDKNNVQSSAKWWQKPNGTGPFRLKQWDPNSQLVLARNSLYYGQMASLDSVVFHFLAGAPMDLYETGTIDVAEIGLPYIDRASDKSGPFYSQLTVVPELSLYYIGFNTAKPPFDDPDIRLAFSMAVDKDQLVSLVSDNTVQVANGIVPPGINGFNPNLAGIGFDVSKAKELIKKSKYGDVSKLPPITLTTAGEGGAVSNDLQALVYQWKQNLGVDVKIREIQPDRFFYDLKQEEDQMYDSGWIADYPSQQDFLDILFHSGSEENFGSYTNPQVDALLDEAGVEPDINKSIELYRQAEQKLVDDAACLPLWFGRDYVLVKPYVKGYQQNPLGFAMLNLVSIQK